MTTHKVFVYGTLKRGEPNHSWFKKENGFSKFLGIGTTLTQYPLIIGTQYNIPFILHEPGVGNNISGEVYEVDEKMLSNLDILEDHPNFYERSITDIKMEVNNSIEKCWLYFIKQFKRSLLKKEMLTSYSSKGPHNLPYCERYLRSPKYDLKADILRQ